MRRKVAFIGMGVMGYPMAGHLHAADYDVSVYNRGSARARRWQAEFVGGVVASSPREAAKGADAVMICVRDDQALREVVLGPDGVFSSASPGTLVIDHTSGSAQAARELFAQASDLGLDFVDAPVSGGEPGAIHGTLAVMGGGEEEAFERAKTFMQCYASDAVWVGPSGAGQLAKMVNQICLAGVIQGLAEGLEFGLASGLDMQALLPLLNKGAAQSWQMDNRGHSMLESKFDHGFAVDLMRKDLSMALSEASQLGLSVPITALVDQFYAQIQQRGGGRLDTSSLVLNLRVPKKSRYD